VGGTGNDTGYGIAVDSSGNVYISGSYGSIPVTIYNADGSTFGSIPNQGGNDAFVVKYNTSGVAQWGARVSGIGNDYGYGVAVDSSGNVYITGQYTSSPVTIYNADGSTFGTIPNQGSYDVYVVKYNTSGVAQWGTHVGGTGTDSGAAIAVDSSGNVYITGYYDSSPVTIYNADGSIFGTIPNQGSRDALVVKYNTSGVALWGTHFGGTANDYGNGIALDSSGNVYISGYYTSNPINFYNA
jgi:hypothetical protein